MSPQCRPLPPAGELWDRYSYNPLTGEIHSRRRPGLGPLGTVTHKGYLHCDHYSGGRHHWIRLHRLVWKWCTGHDPVHTVDHINRCVTDNRIWNLRDVTNREQQRNKGNRKLTGAQAAAIRLRAASGELQRVIAADYGVSRETVSDVVTGATHAQA